MPWTHLWMPTPCFYSGAAPLTGYLDWILCTTISTTAPVDRGPCPGPWMGRNNRSNAVTTSFAWSRRPSDNCENLGINTTLKRAHIALQTFAVCLFPKNFSMRASRLAPLHRVGAKTYARPCLQRKLSTQNPYAYNAYSKTRSPQQTPQMAIGPVVSGGLIRLWRRQ